MMVRLKRKMAGLPIGLMGLCMSLLTLASVVEFLSGLKLHYLVLTFSIGSLILFLGKIFFYPKLVWQEFNDPTKNSFYPTFWMLIFLLSFREPVKTLEQMEPLWVFALIGFYSTLLLWCVVTFKNHNWRKILPSWYIVFVGSVAACMGTNRLFFNGLQVIPQVVFYSGVVAYLSLYVILLGKLWHEHDYLVKVGPNIGIFAAPASLCLAGYFQVATQVHPFLLAILLLTSVGNLLVVYSLLPRFFKAGFQYTYAAFTFPLANSAFALQKYARYLGDQSRLTPFIKFFTWLETLIALLVVGYVLFYYLLGGLKSLRQVAAKEVIEE